MVLDRRIVAWMLIVFFFLTAILGCLIFAPYGGARGVRFEVAPGDSARAVAQTLRGDGVIVSERLFIALASLRGATQHLQAGIYELDSRESLWKVVSLLAQGQVRLVRVTVPEGYASWQIAARLDALHVCPQDEFVAAVRQAGTEGFLFPQTYFLRPGMRASEVVALMEREFERNWRRSLAGLTAPPGLNKKGVVTLASIVEREAKKDFERPLVSAVFLNRLRKRWRLESCATVQYSLGWWKPKLSLKDLRTVSLYNTYQHAGLPPGPICSPGLPSLKAVFSPAQTEDLFFLADGQGTHSFFSTYREHLAEKLRRKRAIKN